MNEREARAVLLQWLADRSRLAILGELAGGERRVSDLVAATGLGQPNVSKHLACLWECGLVERVRHGREVHHRLGEGVSEVLGAADAIAARAGDRLLACPRYGHGLSEAA